MWEEGTGTSTSSLIKFTFLICSFGKNHLKFSAILKTIFHIIEFAFCGIPKWKHIKNTCQKKAQKPKNKKY
jgi:hypothetical protein